MKVLDLDVLRPEPRIVKLAGEEIDVSFIPCAITFDIDTIVGEIARIPKADIMSGGEGTRKAFDLQVRMCSVFCQHKHPDMDETWFRENVDAFQVKAFSDAIREALQRAYAGIGGGPKNEEPPKRKRK